MEIYDLRKLHDYNNLKNHPSINGVQLSGNVTLNSLGLIQSWIGTTAEYENDRSSLPPQTLCFITDDDQ